jgi:hypothetical protein
MFSCSSQNELMIASVNGSSERKKHVLVLKRADVGSIAIIKGYS